MTGLSVLNIQATATERSGLSFETDLRSMPVANCVRVTAAPLIVPLLLSLTVMTITPVIDCMHSARAEGAENKEE